MGFMPVARLPPFLMNTDQRERCLNQLRSKATGLEKYIYLNGLKDRDPNLFYEILIGNMLEIIPILYTPTVNLFFSFRQPPKTANANFSPLGWGRLF
jgi:hypothetical protein